MSRHMPMSIDPEQLQKAVSLLKSGGVIVFPTETSYGLGCDATNLEAVERLGKMKWRPEDQAMTIIVADLEMAKEYAQMDPAEIEFAEKHWPGPMTLVLHNASEKLAPWCRRVKNTVGVRVSSYELATALTRELGRPIIATSANLHGHPSCYDVDEVNKQFDGEDRPDCIVDVGALDRGNPPSMIVELVNGEMIVHRKGSFRL